MPDDNHLINIVINQNLMTNAEYLLLCALYCVRCFAYLTVYDSYGISTSAIKMQHREVK